jgi:hypothetical protein
MDTLVVITLAVVAGLAMVIMMSWCAAVGWRRIMQDNAPLPFFSMLRRHGLALEDIQAASIQEKLALAVRHCTMCSDKKPCIRSLAYGERDGAPYCPNERFFEEAKSTLSQQA